MKQSNDLAVFEIIVQEDEHLVGFQRWKDEEKRVLKMENRIDSTIVVWLHQRMGEKWEWAKEWIAIIYPIYVVERDRLWVFIPLLYHFCLKVESWVRQQNITISSSAYGVLCANHFISGGVRLLRCKISPFPLCNAVFFLHLPPHNNKHNLICLVWSAFDVFLAFSKNHSHSLCHCSRFPLWFHVYWNSRCEVMGARMS